MDFFLGAANVTLRHCDNFMTEEEKRFKQML